MKEENGKDSIAYPSADSERFDEQQELPSSDYMLSHCLYFTVSRFARQMDKLAEEAFAAIELPPSYAYLMITLNDHAGISQKELCEKLTIAPSTSTRFIDKLVGRNLVERKADGKQIMLCLTEEGKALCQKIYQSLEAIYLRHAEILEQSHSKQLITLLHEASELMKKHDI
ncbi:MarR family winged helix-turn-helix transcriptional regulator [Brevibacillus reuszeri]|uniref:MarR family winged helix-turn-helix transcriptional regulator n=1 Tax=Brevibacillus reuszeri TaxID=54915 RepID=UPI001F40A7C3|nr:MarR family transcriptional regulator [Brevibacillus reuszeri]